MANRSHSRLGFTRKLKKKKKLEKKKVGERLKNSEESFVVISQGFFIHFYDCVLYEA